jgi:uncharacterized protein
VDYPPGTPSWVDLSSPDLDASAGFYGELFGWRAEAAGPADETGGYRIFTLAGESVAGLGPAREGEPPHWTTYVAVADADETQEKVDAAGGKTLVPVLDVGEAGRMALFADGADGAVFGIWQPGYNRGAQTVNRPGAMAWNELDTREPDAAESFYADVFGWSTERIEQDGSFVYGSLQLDGRKIGGLLPMGDEFPAHMPASWVVYFGVDDIDATAAKAEKLGGGVRMPRREVPAGAFSVLSDLHGAVFAVVEGTFDAPPPW